MPPDHSLTRVLVVPRNGYVNRLQAWASASILSEQLSVPLSVLWEPEPAAAALAADLFAPNLVAASFIDSAEALDWIGRPHEQLPRYLTVHPERRLVVLAGHDRGEQAFMSQLPSVLTDECRPHTLVIIAGGKFDAQADARRFLAERTAFYSRLQWAPAIVDRIDHLLEGRDPYLGLHLRYTDRSHQAPRARDVRQALRDLRDRTGLRDVLVAADSAATRETWARTATSLHLRPWASSATTFDRASALAGLEAMVDWLLLARSTGMVYFAASSFAEEAAVASGRFDESIELAPSRVRHAALVAGDHLSAAVTYPKRHGWLGRSPS